MCNALGTAPRQCLSGASRHVEAPPVLRAVLARVRDDHPARPSMERLECHAVRLSLVAVGALPARRNPRRDVVEDGRHSLDDHARGRLGEMHRFARLQRDGRLVKGTGVVGAADVAGTRTERALGRPGHARSDQARDVRHLAGEARALRSRVRVRVVGAAQVFLALLRGGARHPRLGEVVLHCRAAERVAVSTLQHRVWESSKIALRLVRVP